MEDTDEQWRAVRDWEGFYEVSNLGRVRSVARLQKRGAGKNSTPTLMLLKGRILRPGYHEKGYEIVALSDVQGGRKPRTFRVHRLVCEAFNGPAPGPEYEVAHNDNTRANNVATNLRWATHYDNVQDAVRARAERGYASR